jgi:plasmid maintenance system killer protein
LTRRITSITRTVKAPPSNRLHALKGDIEGQFAISINDQWQAKRENQTEIEKIKPLRAA